MSHYSRALKFVKSKKYKKLNADPFSEFVLLAIAREADKQGYLEAKAQLTDEELNAAVNRETHLHCKKLAKKLLTFIGEKDTCEDNVDKMLGIFITSQNLHGAEEIIPALEKAIITLKTIPNKLLKEHITGMKSLFVVH